jgi:clan AA aspartic protease
VGKVMNTIRLRNATEVDKATEGLISAARTETLEALVDTGATMLAIPADVVERLGLPLMEMRKVKLATGTVVEVPCVGRVDLELLGRRMTCDALVLPAGATALIGQLQLEGLDLIVDPKAREVRVNPASPDTPMMDLLAQA